MEKNEQNPGANTGNEGEVEFSLETMLNERDDNGGEGAGEGEGEGGEEGEQGGGGNQGGQGQGTSANKNTGTENRSSFSSFSRFSEFDKDIKDEESLYNTVKKITEERENYKLLAQGQSAIDNDPNIKSWRDWARKPNDELYLAEHINNYIDAGMTEEEATAEAKAKLEKATPEERKELALQIKAGLNKAIRSREAEIQEAIKKASKNVDTRGTDQKLHQATIEALSKTETFFGLKFGETEKSREKMLKDAETVFTSGEFEQALNDPEFRATIALAVKYKKQFMASIAGRGSNGKAKLLQRIPTAPISGGPGAKTQKAQQQRQGGQGSKKFDPSKFK